jgi:hypothetical protein
VIAPRAVAISTTLVYLKSVEFFYEPSGLGPLGNNNGCSFSRRAHRAPVGRCAAPRLRARPPPDPKLHTDISKLEKKLTSVFCLDMIDSVGFASALP